ncbi:hypothetical protein PR048_025222 [Dryococelus australis]|uniref:Uncharacterized protein n=1 Tax=Dryococelus australis TaxID=614101 RepID=A0ABQ9GQU3_9NEOP|nr:hypothetical protein PR048_025222 [Dryococelus australis]
MINGKVCHASTDTAYTIRCCICGQTSKDFNKLNTAKKVSVEALKFGLSILHARIRFFESLLHLAYEVPLKMWQARSAEGKKKVVKETIERTEGAFKEEMGLLVDVPEAGFRNTNDGSSSRRFLSDPECSSRITGVNVDLIKRFKIILEVISSGNSIDVNKFDAFALRNRKIIHKSVWLASYVTNYTQSYIAWRNKHFRQHRLYLARKFSRVDCNRDILHRLLLISDPYLSSSRPRQQKKSKPFSNEAVILMIARTPPLPLNNKKSDQSIEDKDEQEPSESY